MYKQDYLKYVLKKTILINKWYLKKIQFYSLAHVSYLRTKKCRFKKISYNILNWEVNIRNKVFLNKWQQL